MFYLLTVMRQRILALPSAYGPRLVGMADAHSAGDVLREAELALLDDLQNLPDRVTDPNWLESLGENGEKPGTAAGAHAKGKSRKPTSPHPAAPGRRKPAATS